MAMLTEDQTQEIIQHIKEAEKQTSGEIRVHIEEKTQADLNPLERAQQIFMKLNMHQTAQRNGVLFYVAIEARKFAICGDKGINEVVPAEFWNSTRDAMREHFRQNDLVQGLCTGIEMAGVQLKTYFPRQSDDQNELPDEISFS
ncbi:TPM domain-containing protein [Siphonobacter sp. SORGH_AS_0500]|uniref:TPM domain-containing protein n=1 Tax=Siphonobacter sp. SORGH_AS_0500 TaxID=1864824 RepID=UPI00285CD418|nr:TPM domain-containing protein [Siphonobacter sp. SORGH_AS_0500]MDR6193965.1 putative membrane protein [Siphonobacter sp. SORGH_AS_0500]